jgi:hypothetical protein
MSTEAVRRSGQGLTPRRSRLETMHARVDEAALNQHQNPLLEGPC